VPQGGGKSESRDGKGCATRKKLKEAGRKLEESWRSTEEACEDPGWLLPLQLAKKGQDGWACPGEVG